MPQSFQMETVAYDERKTQNKGKTEKIIYIKTAMEAKKNDDMFENNAPHSKHEFKL